MNANVIDIREAQADADYLRLQKFEHERLRDFHKRLHEHPQRSAILDAIVDITEILGLDNLRCKAAGYSPRSWQEALHAFDIISDAAVVAVTKRYQEARH